MTRRGQTRLALGVPPDIGDHLGIIPINGHQAFRDNILFVLNNNAGFNQIHIHRNGNGDVLFISKKTTADGADPGTPVGHTESLWTEAVEKVRLYPARGG